MAKQATKSGADKKKYVYSFGAGKADGDGSMKALLGGKGANLAEMANLKLPVPPGFTITTDVCTHFYKHGKSYPESLKAEVTRNLKTLEECMGLEFGSDSKPLLVSVRSGARVSMSEGELGDLQREAGLLGRGHQVAALDRPAAGGDGAGKGIEGAGVERAVGIDDHHDFGRRFGEMHHADADSGLSGQPIARCPASALLARPHRTHVGRVERGAVPSGAALDDLPQGLGKR